MKYYFSGAPALGDAADKITQACQSRLLSCHYLSSAVKWFDQARLAGGTEEKDILIDSGAFSAWSLGDTVTLDQLVRKYDSLIEDYEPYFKRFWLINLDVIPGEKGRTPNDDEIAAALIQSDKNFGALFKRFGDRVLPVFHQGEAMDRLPEIIAQNPKYICISPRNDVHEAMRREWAALVHRSVSKETMTHGLATTGRAMMESIPWCSVDSATWVTIAAMGQVSIFNGTRIYNVTLSAESPVKAKLGAHYDSIPPILQERVVQALDECGVTLEDAKTKAHVRYLVNLIQVSKYVDNMKVKAATVQENLF